MYVIHVNKWGGSGGGRRVWGSCTWTRGSSTTTWARASRCSTGYEYYLTSSVYNEVLHKSIPVQIRQLIFHTTNNAG